MGPSALDFLKGGKTMEYRKNMSLRIGVIAAVIALITLVGISGTFAKYVYQSDGTGSGNNQARVAK